MMKCVMIPMHTSLLSLLTMEPPENNPFYKQFPLWITVSQNIILTIQIKPQALHACIRLRQKQPSINNYVSSMYTKAGINLFLALVSNWPTYDNNNVKGQRVST